MSFSFVMISLSFSSFLLRTTEITVSLHLVLWRPLSFVLIQSAQSRSNSSSKTYQVDEAPHGVLSVADAFTRVKASFRHVFRAMWTRVQSRNSPNRTGKKKKKYWKRKPQNSCLSEQCTLIVSGTQTQNGGWEETAELGSVSILYKLCNNDVLGA